MLTINLLFLNKAQKEHTYNAEFVKNAQMVSGNFAILASHLNDPGSIEDAVAKEPNDSKVIEIFFTTNHSVFQQLNLIKSIIRDSINVGIIQSLDKEITTEFYRQLKENEPNSVINHKSTLHLASLLRINTLISRAIQRSNFLIETYKKKVGEDIKAEKAWTILFIVITSIVCLYTTYHLFRQKSKSKIRVQELIITNQLLKNAQRIAHFGNWEYNLETDELYWSDEVYCLFGVEKTENDQLHFRDFEKRIHSDDRNILIALKSMTRKEGSLLDFHHRIISESGEEKIVYHIAEIVFNKETNTYWLMGTIRDATKEIQNLVTLKNVRRDLLKIIDCSLDIICTIDKGGNFIHVSAAAEQIWGYTPAELTGKAYLSLVYWEDCPKTIDGAAKVMKGLEINNFENRYVRKDGSLVPIAWSARWDSKDEIMYCVARNATEKLQNEAILKASEKKYKNLFENNPLPMFIWDVETLQIVDANEEALMNYGYTRDEFLRLTIWDIVPSEDISMVEQAIKTDEVDFLNDSRIWRHKKKNGEVMLMTVTGHLLEHNNIKKAWLVAPKDITEKLHAEQQREFEKRDKEALINATNDLMWSVDSNFKLIAGNKSFVKYFDDLGNTQVKPGDDLLMQNIYPEDYLRFWKEMYEKCLLGNSFEKEMHAPGMDVTQESWWVINFNPIYEDNMVVGIACYAKNITEKKKAIKDLQTVHERLFFHLENSPTAFIEWDTEVRPKTWSKRAEEIFGWTKDETTTKQIDWFSQVYEEDLPLANRVANELIAGKVEKNHVQHRNYSKDGKVIWCDWFNTVLRGEDGEIISILSLIQDITERKKNEKDLIESNEELRSLSAHLQNIREEERIRIAREIHDELGQQLTGIKLNISWLNKKLIDNDKEIRSKITNSINLINTSINTVREIAAELRPGILDDLGLSEAIEWQGLQFTQETGIPVEFLCNVVYEKFPADISNNVFRILQESLTNVARHAHASIVICTLQKTNDHLLLQVSDNGDGFNKDQPGNRKALGLLGMRERVEILKGKYEIVSLIGRGTIISAEIPLPHEEKKLCIL